ncbi:MAG: ribonuclease D [Bacteroidia bacterium]|jgi:ribonuclease D
MSETVEYRWVDSDQGLQECVAYLSGASELAIDTEFMRTDTFYPIPALLQLSDGQIIYLIDPLAIGQWQPLRELMLDSSITKVLHSVSEDMEVFQRLLDCVPQPLLDTQVGAGLAGFGSGLGYQKLIDQLLGIAVEKGETRSNWLQRPLSESQCVYAALDVEHLLPAFRHIQRELEAQGRMEWWREEGQRQVRMALVSLEPKDYFKRIKSAWKLNAQQQAQLREICAWRELQARAQDVPRGRILKDPVCVDIARRRPAHPAALAAIPDIRDSTVRKHGETICDILSVEHSLQDQELLARPLEGAQKGRLKVLREQLDTLSEELNVPREMLLNKRDMEALVRNVAVSSELQGWRSVVLATLVENLSAEAQ